MPELLSPVGNMDCLMAAINGGCDAVYLAGKAFGARGFAGNFNKEELVEAIRICHLHHLLFFFHLHIYLQFHNPQYHILLYYLNIH